MRYFRAATQRVVGKWSGEKILQSQGNVKGYYFESGGIDNLKKRREILTQFKTGDLIPMKTGRKIWGDCDVHDVFPS